MVTHLTKHFLPWVLTNLKFSRFCNLCKLGRMIINILRYFNKPKVHKASRLIIIYSNLKNYLSLKCLLRTVFYTLFKLKAIG